MKARRWLPSHPLFVLYLGIVTASTVLLLWATIFVGNIAAGLATFPVLLLGLPWSLLYFSPLSPGGPIGEWSPPIWAIIVATNAMVYMPAWINVALAYVVLRWLDRRRAPRGEPAVA